MVPSSWESIRFIRQSAIGRPVVGPFGAERCDVGATGMRAADRRSRS